MQIEIWSDMICPWCYIGKRRFEKALMQFGQRDNINLIWRSFELDPAAPPRYPGTLNEMLAHKYGVSLQQAAEMNVRVTGLAAEVGLEYRLTDARPGNTFDAHRLLHLAAAHQQGAWLSSASCTRIFPNHCRWVSVPRWRFLHRGSALPKTKQWQCLRVMITPLR